MHRVCGCVGRVRVGSKLCKQPSLQPKVFSNEAIWRKFYSTQKENPHSTDSRSVPEVVREELHLDQFQSKSSRHPIWLYNNLIKMLEYHQARMQKGIGFKYSRMPDVVLSVPQNVNEETWNWLSDASKSRKPTDEGKESDPSIIHSDESSFDLDSDQYGIKLDELTEDGFANRSDTDLPKKKESKGKTNVEAKLIQPKKTQPDQFLQYYEQIIPTLSSYVEASVLVGDTTQALQILRELRKKITKRYGTPSESLIPTKIYNNILSGYASTDNFNGAMRLRNAMIVNNVRFDANSFAYLLAVSKKQSQKFIKKLLNSMDAYNVKIDQLFLETNFTKVQLEDLTEAIRKVDPQFVVPAKAFPKRYTCRLLEKLNDSRPSETSGQSDEKTPIIPWEDLIGGVGQQWQNEMDGIVKIKSIAAVRKPTAYVKFLRNQVTKLEEKWTEEIHKAFLRELRVLENRQKIRFDMTIYPYLRVIDPKIIVSMLVHEMRTIALSSEMYSPGFTPMCSALGNRVNDIFVISAKIKYGVTPKLKEIYNDYLKVYSPRSTRPEREVWQDLISRHSLWGPTVEESTPTEWSRSTTMNVGRFLFDILRSLQVDINIMRQDAKSAVMVNALYSIFRDYDGGPAQKEELKVHPTLAKLYRDAQLEDLQFNVKMLPMSCPPRPWCNPVDSPFLMSETSLVRIVFENERKDYIKNIPRENIYPAMDALNAVSKCPWIINKEMLQSITQVFLSDGDLKLDIPRPVHTIPVPPPVSSVPKSERNHARRDLCIYQRACNEAYSLWCDMLYKLSIAHHFKDKVFWFPHSMDFRGRVYPCPPHFNHIGSDVVRSCLLFAEGRPLGPNGFNWLKLHLINLTGFKKKESVASRIRYADEIMDDILDSADHPFDGRKWWQTSDEPWQTLAACREIAKVLRCGKDPSEYICHFPIHQDGTCNGLQHYAALGRDIEGAAQVNLRPMDLPQDVYSGVADVVERLRKRDAAEGVPIAQILEGFIQRKVVKQTVMTVVYGVTRYGAQLQILRQLQDIDTFPQKHVHEAARYLVGKTFLSLHEMFTATREIQDWFSNCARKISKVTGQPVEWTTPLGLPIIQPYFAYKKKKKRVLMSLGDKGEKVYIDMVENTSQPNSHKQKNAFPPNFIHSLDSSHMMLTAIHSEAVGITFVSVHDCFWTHACSVEIMNRLCREQFVALHSEPILEDLSKSFLHRFGDVARSDIVQKSAIFELEQLIELIKSVPEKGSFDINEVLKSTYFFG